MTSTHLKGNFFSRYGLHLLTEYLPSKMKRMFYVSSALSFLTRNRSPSKRMLDRVQSDLRMPYDARSMSLSAYVGFDLWKELRLEEKTPCQMGDQGILLSNLEEEVLWKIGLEFAERCPAWLQYGSPQLMATDIHDLLVSLMKVKQA